MIFKVFLVLWFQAAGQPLDAAVPSPPEVSRTEEPDLATCLEEAAQYAGHFVHEVDETSVYEATCRIVALKAPPA